MKSWTFIFIIPKIYKRSKFLIIPRILFKILNVHFTSNCRGIVDRVFQFLVEFHKTIVSGLEDYLIEMHKLTKPWF
jgi:hypothetical protein